MAIEPPPIRLICHLGVLFYMPLNGSSLTSATTFNLVIDVQALTLFSG